MKQHWHNQSVVDEKTFQLLEDAFSLNELGLLETMLWEKQSIFLKQEHIARLQKSYVQLHDATFNVEAVFAFIDQHLWQQKTTFKIRLIVYQKNVLVEVIPHLEKKEPLILGCYNDAYKKKDELSNLKTTDRDLYNQAKNYAAKHGCDDAIILNEQEEIIESALANLFWTKGKHIYTPPLSSGCINGTFRKHWINKLWQQKIEVQERVCTLKDLKEADTVWVGNAVQKLKKCVLNF